MKVSRPLGQEHLIASAQLMKYLKDVIHAMFQELLNGSEVLEDLQLLDYEELGGLSDPGPQDISCGMVMCEI